MKPKQSFIIWFSQRTGSSVLCKALEDTGIAGRPNEWLHEYETYDLLTKYSVTDYASLQAKLWEVGSTPNGVFGLKVSMSEPHHTTMTEHFRKFPDCPQGAIPRARIWEHAFPNCKHIFMTRRNRARLAVSWWKAIKSGEFQRPVGTARGENLKSDEFVFDAIRQLLLEVDMREAGIQEFFSEAGIVPLTLVYEDFVAEYELTIRRILNFLDIPGRDKVVIPQLYFEKLANDLSEEWVHRFRRELQADWQYWGWGCND